LLNSLLDLLYNKGNKKFWEDVIAYFPLIGHGPHRKRKKIMGDIQTAR
jgi:hypothetical protein